MVHIVNTCIQGYIINVLYRRDELLCFLMDNITIMPFINGYMMLELFVHKKISFKHPVLMQDKTLDPPTCSTSQSMQISSSEILNEH